LLLGVQITNGFEVMVLKSVFCFLIIKF